MLETELKSMLTEAQFEALASAFLWNSVKEQTNSYYISPDNALKKNGITFRIRTIDGLHTLQIKKHTSKQGALQISDETEFPIAEIPEEFSAADVYNYTSIETTAALIGELTTKRYSFMYCDGVEICLDKSIYLGTTDYEIEVEYTKPIPKELIEQLKSLGIDFNSPCKGKFSRFMKRLLG